ncbi:MAG TPA: hypothetical protein VE445_09440 [Nitrososphaeraceae archaeon]|nr:hypothetical protein [Nitrososphaeraceae archaeon]
MGSRVTSGSLSQQEKKKNILAVDDETNLILDAPGMFLSTKKPMTYFYPLLVR